MPDKIVNHFVLADGSIARYDYDGLVNVPFGDDVTEVSFKTRTGFISIQGYQENQSSSALEVYTNKIPCSQGDMFTIDLDWNGSTAQKWCAYATFDKDGRFIARDVFFGWNPLLSTVSLTTPAMPDGAGYIAFTYRTYGDCTANIYYKGSLFGVRNRVPKGLVKESTNGEFDTYNGNYDEYSNNEDVARLGYRPVSDFIKVPLNRKITFFKNSEYSDTLQVHLMYFDSGKNVTGASGFRVIPSSGTWFPIPDGVAYVKAVFDNGNGSNNPTSPTADVIKNNVTFFTEYEDEKLTPIICGGGYPVLHTAQKTLEIPHDMVFFKNGNYYTTAHSVIDLTATVSTAKKVYYNTSNSTYEVLPYNGGDALNPAWQKDRVLLCTIRVGLPLYPDSLSITCPYYIDDKFYGIDSQTIDYSAITWAFNENVKGVNHRGYYTAPENTLPAYKLSKKNGFKYAECDVSMTSDRVPVLLHDDTINRTARNADGTEISDTISIGSITYEQALQYDFGIWKGSQYAGTKIPTFEQFITLCRNLGLHPYIELKSAGGYSEAEVQNLVDIVRQNGMDGKVSWISFSSGLLEYVKNYDASARLGFVVGALTSANITTASSLKTATNEVFLDVSSISDNLVDDCITAGLPVEVWTINTESGITALNDYISGVTSDNLIASKVLYEANI